MKLDFLSLGGGGGGGGGGSIPRRAIDRRMRQLDIKPLDHAHDTIKYGLIALGVFIGIFVLYAALAPISAAAIAPGEVKVSGGRVVVQPVSGGIVTKVLVREGQAVAAGQPLVQLNGVRSGAQLAQSQARRDSLKAIEARLIAERDGAETLSLPDELTSRSADPEVAKIIAMQNRLFAERRPVLSADRATSEETLIATRARYEASAKQLALISDELGDYQMLLSKGFARKSTVRALERSQAALQAETIAGQAAVKQAEIAVARIRDAQKLDLSSQLGQVQDQLAQITPQLDVSKYAADQDVIRAAVAGHVSGIAAIGPGTIVGSGKTLMEIVPNSGALIIEVRVKPQDIDDVRLGQEATVRFSTVNPHGKTAFKGRVVTLSPARIDEGGQSFYRAQIVLDDPAAAKRDGLSLQPGIPASANIKTQERTLFSYLFSPFSDAVSHSMREE